MMKKLLFSLLFFPSLAWATYIPVNGSSVTVAPPNGTTLPVDAKQSGTWNVGTVTAVTGITNALPTGTNNVGTVSGSSVTIAPPNGTTLSVNATQTGTWNVGTVTAVTAISNALPTGTNNIGTVTGSTFTLQGSNGSGITSTSGALDINIKSGSIANTGFNVNNTPAVSQSGAWTVAGLNNVVISSFAATVGPMENLVMIATNPVRTSGTTGEQLVSAEISGSSNTVIVSTMQVITISGTSNHIGWDAQGSSMPIASAGPATGVSLASVNPNYAGVYVASSTFPTLRTNGQGQFQVSDPAGRTITVAGVPSWMIKTATITITGTTPITLIASAAASNFNDLCGCVGTNTSATNTYVTFQSTGALGGGWPASDFTLGMPANDIPVGFGPVACDRPIPQRAAAVNWEVQAANSVTDLRLACYYYTIAR